MKLLYAACIAAIAFTACEDKASLSSTADDDGTPVKIGFLVSGDRITYPNGPRLRWTKSTSAGGCWADPLNWSRGWTYRKRRLRYRPLRP